MEKIENFVKDVRLKEKIIFQKNIPPIMSTVINNELKVSQKNQKAPLLAKHNYIINKE